MPSQNPPPNTITSTSVDQLDDPYFLHHGDSPGSVLVTQSLIGENYNTWNRSMIMALTTKNKLGFIDVV